RTRISGRIGTGMAVARRRKRTAAARSSAVPERTNTSYRRNASFPAVRRCCSLRPRRPKLLAQLGRAPSREVRSPRRRPGPGLWDSGTPGTYLSSLLVIHSHTSGPMPRRLLLVLLLVLGSASVRAQDALNMTLVGHLDEWGRYGDVWGYTDPITEREYALLTARDHGLSIIDVTEDQPVEAGFVPGVWDSKDVKTYAHYAYLVNEYAPIQIIDIENPAEPVQVGTLDVQPDVSQGGSHNILIEDDYLYVIGGRSPGGL